MKKANQASNIKVLEAAAIKRTFWSEIKLLFKFRLSIMVVFTSAMAYLIGSAGFVNYIDLLIISLGGFLVTGAANTFNQVLEKDFDKLMDRTKDRPLAAGRMSTSDAVLIAGLTTLVGVGLISYLSALGGFISMLSLILYAFVYTPLKRVTPLSVLIGSIPGALPVLVGFVIAQGTVTSLALSVFIIQIIWQLPHFWAVAWIAHDDYIKAGYYLLPNGAKEKDENVGWASFKYALLLLPFSFIPWYTGDISLIGFILLAILAIGYTWFGWNLYKKCDRPSALKLMFSSFAYLPFVLIVLWLDILI